MLSALISRQVHAEFKPRIDSFLKENGVEIRFEHPTDNHQDTAPGNPIDAAFLTLDIRHSPIRLKQFVDRISANPRFKWVHFPGSGVSQHKWLIPLVARGVRVSTSTGANAESVATTALTGLLMLARRGARWIDGQRSRQWRPWEEPESPPDLAGQTAVIVGMGSIGSRIARYLNMLGMRVIGVRRSGHHADDIADAIEHPDHLPRLLPDCDWLILACSLTDETFHLMDAKAFSMMKQSAYVINISRGDVMDETAFIEAVRKRAIAGGYLDVFSQEPLPVDSAIWSLPDVIVSPHIAALSQGNQWRSTEIFIRNLVRISRNEALVNELPAEMLRT